MSDGLTILLLAPDLSRRSMFTSGAVMVAWSAILAGINVSGLSQGGDRAVTLRAVSCYVDAAAHLAVLLARLVPQWKARMRPSFVPNSVCVFGWRLVSGILMSTGDYTVHHADRSGADTYGAHTAQHSTTPSSLSLRSILVILRTVLLPVMAYTCLLWDIQWWRRNSMPAPALSESAGRATPGAVAEQSMPLLTAGTAPVVLGASAQAFLRPLHPMQRERGTEIIRELLSPATRDLLDWQSAGCCALPCQPRRMKRLRTHIETLAASRVFVSPNDTLGRMANEVEIPDVQLVSASHHINEGTVGNVYPGVWRHRASGKLVPVAIKVFKQASYNDGGRSAFVHERQQLLELRQRGESLHPCIVQYYGYCLCLHRMSLV